jgi:ABC-type transport system involved in multi-copper enzyme maturation permease subunit
MKHLLQIEWIKLRKLNAFYIITAIYVFIIPLWMLGMNFWFTQLNQQIPLFPSTKTLWSFPTVWRFVTYCASYFNILFAVLVILFTTNEFTNRTMRQHVIDGLTQGQVILSKFLVVLGLACFITLIIYATGLGFGLTKSENIDLFANIHYVVLFFLQTLCYLGLAFFLSIFIKKPALAIISYVGVLFVEWVIGLLIPNWMYAYFPMNNISKLTPLPFFEPIVKAMNEEKGSNIVILEQWQIIAISLIFMCLFYYLSYRRLRKMDL